MLRNRRKRLMFDFVVEPCCKSYCAQHAQLVFRKPPVRFSDRPDDACFEVCLPINEIQYFPGVMPHDQPVDREVPPLYILFRGICKDHSVWMSPICITHIGTERCYFHFCAFARNQNHSELRANRYAVRKKLQYL